MVSNVNGVPDSEKDEVSNVLTETTCPESMQSARKCLIVDLALCAKMAQNAKLHPLLRCHPNVVAERNQRIYAVEIGRTGLWPN